jgi:hypothetical protein
MFARFLRKNPLLNEVKEYFMNPYLWKELLWFGNILLGATLLFSSFFAYRSLQEEKPIPLPQAPSVSLEKKKREILLADYKTLWELAVTPPPEIQAPAPEKNIPEEELNAALLVESIAYQGVSKENTFATLQTNRDRRKRLVYIGDFFDYENNLWSRKTQPSKTLHPATIIDIIETGVLFNYKNQRIFLALKVVKNGKETQLVLPPETPQLDENLWKVSVVERDEFFQNLDSYLQESSLVAYYNRGRFAGLKIKQLSEDSLPGKRGLKRYDIVTKVNGMTISSLEQLKMILQRETTNRRFTVSILRLGQPLDLTYEVF